MVRRFARAALGAVRGDIFRMVIGGGLKMAIVGIALGAVAVVTSVWFLARAFRFPELGWSPFVTATAIVAGIAGLASFFPAWRLPDLIIGIPRQHGGGFAIWPFK